MRNILHYLGKIQDPRKNSGKRYQLKSILSLVILGYGAGCISLADVYRFGKKLKSRERLRLGFKGTTPSHPTITGTLKKLNPDELEKVFTEIISSSSDKIKQIAIDGKSICSTSKSDLGLLHLLSAYSPEIRGVVRQIKSELAGGEIKAAAKIIPEINVKNKVITGDALFAQEELCSAIVWNGGNYLFKVKKNKKRIIDDIEQLFNLHNNRKIHINKFEFVKKAHGRIEHRKIETIETTCKYFGGWATNTIKQVAKITKQTNNVKRKTNSTETQFLISSLTSKDSSAKQILDMSIKHWSIENNLHRTRDNKFKEDVCNIACHKSQQICAAMRNLTIFLLNKINNSVTNAINQIRQKITPFLNLLIQRI